MHFLNLGVKGLSHGLVFGNTVLCIGVVWVTKIIVLYITESHIPFLLGHLSRVTSSCLPSVFEAILTLSLLSSKSTFSHHLLKEMYKRGSENW